VVKATVERVLVGAGVPSWSARMHRQDVCILAYHNVVPDDLGPVGDVSLHLPRRDFRDQLDDVGRRFDIVPLTELYAAPARRARPRVAITFDDAYQGALAIGIEELARRGFPATMFVAPEILGRRSLWWDVFAPPARGSSGGLSAAIREEALTECAGRDARVREWAQRAGWASYALPEPALTGTEAELVAACARHSGLTLGSHSWSHANLTRLDAPGLDAELRPSLDWLRQRFDRTIDWLAYPYGYSSPVVAAAAREAGFRAGLLVGGGWARGEGDDAFAVPRVNVPAGISRAGFAIRMSGLT
jgi:peptidoglycan/xylan/chitin deacetylase (PgdA/CDA1 family)